MNRTLTEKQLERRAGNILSAVQTGTVQPDSDAVCELAEILDELQDAKPVKPAVVARLTVTRANGWKTIVEVEEGSKFHSFFRYYRQFRNKRSTKELIRVANRAEHLMSMITSHREPGLEGIAHRMQATSDLMAGSVAVRLGTTDCNPIVSLKLRIFKKRAYKQLLTAAPDPLGIVRSTPSVSLPKVRFALVGGS